MPGPIVAEVLRRVERPRKSAAGWTALCPAHEDREPSLSLAEGSDGRALLTCHRGCPVDAIAAALGLTMADLFPPRDSAMPYTPPRSNGATAPKVLTDTADEKKQWPVVAEYTYTDAQGQPIFQVLRKEPAIQLEGVKRRKTFVQRRRNGERWEWSLE